MGGRTDTAQSWPPDIECAVAFTFDFDAEEVWLADDPANAGRPGLLSQGTYGAKVAVPLILEVLARHSVPATFFVPGRVAERHPGRVAEIAAAGHELGHHGYTHTSPSALTPAQEEEELVRGMDALARFAPTLRGYRSPSWEFSPHTLGLLEKHGFEYSSNLMDDVRPYLHPGAGIVELPVHWILDDAVHFWFGEESWTKKISTVDEVRAIWTAEFEGIRRLGGCCVFTMHPQFIGRPGRLPLLEAMIAVIRETPGVWVAQAHEIAEHARRALAPADGAS
ncbi:MAG TPA: polysaccharide deacetylase [Thermoleophilia bacterium]|nr:polysaccharide deacetylase [Thermoleophilia bacterium]